MKAADSVHSFGLLKHVLIEHIPIYFDVEYDLIPSRYTSNGNLVVLLLEIDADSQLKNSSGRI